MANTPKPQLYYMEMSPSSRAVLFTARLLNVDLELIACSTFAMDHLTPEFIARNPQHCVPTLVDGATVVWDSHAICAYLSARYAGRTAGQLAPADKSLSPSDARSWAAERALFDQRMHYHHGCLFARYYACISPVFKAGATSAGSAAQLAAIDEALGFLDTFLAGNASGYVAGAELSVVDVLCALTVSSIEHVLHVDVAGGGRWPHVAEWQARMKRELPDYEKIETPGVANMAAKLTQQLAENRAK